MFGLRRFALVLGLVGGALAVASACSNSGPSEKLGRTHQAIDTGVDGGPTLALLNEINKNPPGGDGNYEFVELRGTPGAPLTGFYLVAFEGDATGGGANPGVADYVLNLGTACGGAATPCRFGTNGLAIVTASTGGHTIPAATTKILDANLNGGALENGSITFMLIYSPTTAITQGTDYDTGAVGDLNALPATAQIADSIGWKDGDTADVVYGGAELTPAALDAAAVVRFADDDTPSSAGAWYGGQLTGTTSTTAFSTTTGERSANFPAGGALTPGAANVGLKNPDAGADAATDADAADTAVADAADAADAADTAVAADAADTAPADTGTAADTDVDTGTVADTGAAADTDVDTGAADTGAAADADLDTGAAADTGAAEDTGAAADTGTAEDTGTTEDTGSAEDTGATTTDTGLPTVDTGVEEPVGTTADDSGCGCRTPRYDSANNVGLAALALGLVFAARRRRDR